MNLKSTINGKLLLTHCQSQQKQSKYSQSLTHHLSVIFPSATGPTLDFLYIVKRSSVTIRVCLIAITTKHNLSINLMN